MKLNLMIDQLKVSSNESIGQLKGEITALESEKTELIRLLEEMNNKVKVNTCTCITYMYTCNI